MKYLVSVTIAVAVLVIAGFYFFYPGSQDTMEQIDVATQPTLGEEEAEVTIIEFGDYKCPACKVWDETVFQQLKDDYIENGQANFAFINAPFHGAESMLAALASESVWHNHPEAFWEYHEALYHAQPEAAGHDAQWVTVDELLRVAAEDVDQEIDLEVLTNDLLEQTYSEQVEEDIELVQEHDIQLTPTIVINGHVIEDPFDYEEIVETIQSEL
ncbi:DsbA family protein [Geomicrobium sp. JCM 19055]|uniref:DsbA family protein n=1 Tax=Geomicrobium sp. JCM 19055 TaxID=1460649 RepID=UPI00045ED8B5|nr:DsbA family protein [Geomicrobium sp. JCM 19055]GAJ97989.1 thiol:disulfide interchange protein [Geomicrobium sp. JCM 19055]